MEPLYPLYDDDFADTDDIQLCIQTATKLTASAMALQMIKPASSTEETAEQVMLFFDVVYRRVRDLTQEDEDDFLDQVEENGEIEPL